MSNDDYEVGYGKPPKTGKFKAGQSGNPNGRPKKDKDKAFITILADELKEVVALKDGSGEKQFLSKKEVIIKRLLSDAMSGKQSAIKALLEIGKNGQAIYWL